MMQGGGPAAVLLIKVGDISRAVTSAEAATSLEGFQRRNRGVGEEFIMALQLKNSQVG